MALKVSKRGCVTNKEMSVVTCHSFQPAESIITERTGIFSLQTESEDEEGVSLEVKMVETSMKTRGWGHHRRRREKGIE